MSTGNISLDILLDKIREDVASKTDDSVVEIVKRYPCLSISEAKEIRSLIAESFLETAELPYLVVTAPPSFALKAKNTKVVISNMLENATSSILITGYSLSEYFNDLVDLIINKSQKGVFVKFFVNKIENQISFDKLCRYKSKFLRIYNYPEKNDKMSALHAKVISVDKKETLITSANLSYHGQEGNIELGCHIISENIANQVEDVFTKLVFSKVFTEV